MKRFLKWEHLCGACIGAGLVLVFTEHRVAALVLLIFAASVEYQIHLESK